MKRRHRDKLHARERVMKDCTRNMDRRLKAYYGGAAPSCRSPSCSPSSTFSRRTVVCAGGHPQRHSLSKIYLIVCDLVGGAPLLARSASSC